MSDTDIEIVAWNQETGAPYCDAEYTRQLKRELNEAKRQAALYNADTMNVMEQRDQWKAMAQELFELLEGNHHSGCSIQSPEEPHCDCGYQQGLEVALSRFNELNKP